MALPIEGVACEFQVTAGSWLRGALAVQLRSPAGNSEHHTTSSGTLEPSPAASVLPPQWPSPAWLHFGAPCACLFTQSSCDVLVYALCNYTKPTEALGLW